MEATTRPAPSPKPGEFDPVGQKVHPLDDAPAAMVVESEVLGPEVVDEFLPGDQGLEAEDAEPEAEPPVTPEEQEAWEDRAALGDFDPDAPEPEAAPKRQRSELAGKRIVFVFDTTATEEIYGQTWALLIDNAGEAQLFEAHSSGEAVKLALSAEANEDLAVAVKERPGSIYMAGIPASSFQPTPPAPRKVTSEWTTAR